MPFIHRVRDLPTRPGAAFPERYQHVDGGTYRGEWKGMLKEGYGVYTYPSGARYEGEASPPLPSRPFKPPPRGRLVRALPAPLLSRDTAPPCAPAGEWRGGVKEGRGVYHFPKGGVYEGEWRDGRMAGLGVRTYASGRVQVGARNYCSLLLSRPLRVCVLSSQHASRGLRRRVFRHPQCPRPPPWLLLP